MGTMATTTGLAVLMPGVTFDAATTTLAGKCLDWAETRIKSKLSRRYDVSVTPFTVATTTSALTSLTEQFAMGHLYKNISRGAKESISRGDALIKDAEMVLQDLMDGSIDLVNADGTDTVNELSAVSEVFASYSAYHTTFDEDDPLDWTVDQDKLDSISNSRG